MKNYNLRELERAHREHQKNIDDVSKDIHDDLKISILSNYSTQFVSKAIGLSMFSRGYKSTVYEASYNQWEFELINKDSHCFKNSPDFVLIALSSLLLPYHPKSQDPKEFVTYLKELILNAQQRSSATFIVTLLEPSEESLDPTSLRSQWLNSVNNMMVEILKDVCFILNLDSLVLEKGIHNWSSPQFLITAKLPFHPDFSCFYASHVCDFICAIKKRPTRLIITDLDNTLWNGIVGEIGYDNVDLNFEEKGLPHLRLQRMLLDLHNQGVVLAISSKNTESNALEVFENRNEMILKKEHFASIKINWLPKSQNINDILSELNLTETGTTFLDDSKLEREEVKQAFPEIYVPELPEDSGSWVEVLLESGKFLIPSVSKEDLNRQESYKAEAQRNSKKMEFNDLSGFLQSLNLELEPIKINAENIDRVESLVNKTNQFNLTTRRHNRSKIESFVRGNNYGYCFSLKDKYSDYGIIGVLLGEPKGHSLMIDTWLLSCRAMGRTVENAMLKHFQSHACSINAGTIIGEYIPTSKNIPVENLFASLEFSQVENRDSDPQLFELSVKNDSPVNEHVELVGPFASG